MTTFSLMPIVWGGATQNSPSRAGTSLSVSGESEVFVNSTVRKVSAPHTSVASAGVANAKRPVVTTRKPVVTISAVISPRLARDQQAEPYTTEPSVRRPFDHLPPRRAAPGVTANIRQPLLCAAPGHAQA